MRKSLCLTAAAVCSLIASVTPTAKATLLPVNTSVAPNSQANPLSTATLMASTGVEAFNVSLSGSTMAGNVQEWVVNNFPGNIFGSQYLTFVFQVTLDRGASATGAPAIIQRLTDDGFLGSVTDAGYTAATGNVVPSAADRSAIGDVIGFNFQVPNPSINVGANSDYLIINTNQTQYAASVLSVQGTLSANLAGYSPSAVPEPTSLALGGIAGLGMLARRRRASNA